MKIRSEEKRLKLFLEESLRTINIDEKEMAYLYIGILKIMEEQGRHVKQLHGEIESRLGLHFEENETVRKLLGTSESVARLRVSRFAQQITVLKERLYEKDQLAKRVAELEKENKELELKLMQAREGFDKRMKDHFDEIEGEKNILQHAFLDLGLEHEKLVKEVAAQKNTLQSGLDDLRKKYFMEFQRTFQSAKQKDALVVENIMTDFVLRMRSDIKNVVRHIESCLDNLDLKKIGIVLPVEKLTPGKLRMYLKGLRQTLVFLNKLIHKQHAVADDFKSIAETLKVLDNASKLYLSLIKPIRAQTVNISPYMLKDRIENLYFALNNSSDIKLSFDIDENLPNLIIDINSLSIALKEVFTNACAAIMGEGSIEVKLSYKSDSNEFILRIANNGRPVAEKMRHRIFDPFISDKAGREGLGLTRASIACQRMGGSIRLMKSNEDETVFNISFPAFLKA